MTIELPPASENSKIIKRIAKEEGIKPGTLNGLIQIEGSPVLKAQLAGETSIPCKDTINSAGAVGLTSIIQGDCTTDDRPELKKLHYDVNACDFEASIRWTAEAYKADLEYQHGDEILAACSYYYGKKGAEQYGPKCAGAEKLGPGSGCEGLNYGECVIEKYGKWDKAGKARGD